MIRGMLFRIYRLAKNQADKGDSLRGIVQIITTERRWKNEDRMLELRLPGCRVAVL